MIKDKPKKAVFLDRDGVIVQQGVNYLTDIDMLKILPGAVEAIKKFKNSDYRVVVITNQSVIARGLAEIETVEAIHDELKRRLSAEGAEIDAIYYCPHHPGGKIKEYAVKCVCRKPETGLIEKALEDYDLDLSASFLVGDQTIDILAGQRKGLKTILVKTGYGGEDNQYKVKPDYIVEDILEASDLIN